MAKTYFQAKVTLISATPTNGDNTEWECAMLFTDFDGSFTGIDVRVGDMIAFDTSSVETGTFTLYEVISTPALDLADIILGVRYATTNNNDAGPPDLGWILGQDGVISRPSENVGLLPVVSKDIQIVTDKFTEYVQNYNFVQIVDKMLSGNRVYSKVNGETGPILKWMVVYISEINTDQCLLASATTHASSDVLGLVADIAAAPGSTCVISSGSKLEKTTADWDIITGGTGGLIPGKDYFLRADFPGGIHYVPPQDAGNFIVKIGKAVSSTILDINIDQPIEL